MTNALIETYDASGNGPRVAVKDCIDIAGRATRCGSRAFADAPAADRDAMVVQALRTQGFRIAAKAAMHELAYGMTGLNDWTGPVDNPLYPGLIPGGSSSGSASAVAAGLVDLALGTDTGGSVRLPAACCGVLGFKPGFDRLSRDGLTPAQSVLDCVGIFSRDLAVMEAAMAAMDGAYVPVDMPGAVRIARLAAPAEAAIMAAVDAALALPAFAVSSADAPLLDDAFRAGVIAMAAEASAAFGHFVGKGVLGADVEQRLAAAPQVATVDALAWADGVKARFIAEIDALFETHDLIALPTLPAFPPRIDALGDPAAVLRLSAYVRPFNLSGHPALSIPVETGTGLPAAIQLVAPMGRDARLFSAARRIVAAAPIS